MNDILKTIVGLMLPFAGTSAGAAAVYLLKKGFDDRIKKMLLGFAAGVMMAASVWSLLLPALSLSETLGKLAFLPAAVGFLLGAALLTGFDLLICKIERRNTRQADGAQKKTVMLILAVTLHNLPEGMAVGVVFAGLLTRSSGITFAGAMTLSLGIALQNVPEGAIISMPLAASGVTRSRAMCKGVLSGIVEPIGALLTLALSSVVAPMMPYLLSFAAGAMIYVVVKELIPESQEGGNAGWATHGAVAGFVLMMILDVALS